jgi:hypothetical protein
MASDPLTHRLLEQVGGVHLTLVRFVAGIPVGEWEWSPDAGLPSAKDVAAAAAREEARLAGRVAGHAAGHRIQERDLAAPKSAASVLRALREVTLAELGRALEGGGATPSRVAETAVQLAQIDSRTLAELSMLQRLIDPSRAAVAPR